MKTGDVAVIAIVIFAPFFGAIMGSAQTRRYYRKQAVVRGYAEYTSDTGTWQWKENPTGESDAKAIAD